MADVPGPGESSTPAAADADADADRRIWAMILAAAADAELPTGPEDPPGASCRENPCCWRHAALARAARSRDELAEWVRPLVAAFGKLTSSPEWDACNARDHCLGCIVNCVKWILEFRTAEKICLNAFLDGVANARSCAPHELKEDDLVAAVVDILTMAAVAELAAAETESESGSEPEPEPESESESEPEPEPES